MPFLFLFWFQTDFPAEGRKALEANNYALAAEHYAKAVESDPKDWTSRFHLALSLSLLNKDNEAAAEYRKVLEAQPGLYEAELNLGILLVRVQQPADAVKLLESAAAKKATEYRPVFYLAEALLASGDAAGAEPRYRTALQIQPKSAEAMIGLARSLVKLNRLADAAVFYEQASTTDSEYKPALLELAQLYEQAKESEKAIAIYRQFPDNPGARERMGELLLEGGKAAEAIPELEKAYTTSPTNANRVALATAYWRSKQPLKAVPLLEQAVAAEPENFELRMYHGRALRDQRKFQPAVREFFRATKIKPDAKEAWSELASSLMLLENYPQSISALDRAVSLGADATAASYFRAVMLDRMRDYKQALPAYQKFLALSEGKNAEQELISRQRIRVIQKELSKR